MRAGNRISATRLLRGSPSEKKRNNKHGHLCKKKETTSQPEIRRRRSQRFVFSSRQEEERQLSWRGNCVFLSQCFMAVRVCVFSV